MDLIAEAVKREIDTQLQATVFYLPPQDFGYIAALAITQAEQMLR